jgi:uncharacterized protein YjbJ (UPF0337 family)
MGANASRVDEARWVTAVDSLREEGCRLPSTDGPLSRARFIYSERSFDIMSKEEIKGKGKQIKGKVREEVGKLTDNKKEQVKGKVEQAAGKAEENVGKAIRKSKKQ